MLLCLNLGKIMGLLFGILIFFLCSLGLRKEMEGVVLFLVFFDLLKWQIDFLIIGKWVVIVEVIVIFLICEFSILVNIVLVEFDLKDQNIEVFKEY